MEPLPRTAKRFIGLTIAGGWSALAAVLLMSRGGLAPEDVTVCVVLALLTVLGELRPITVARGDATDDITVSTTFVLALTLVGPLWVSMTVLAAAVALDDARTRKGAVKLSFNVAQYMLTLLVVRAVYSVAGGHAFLHGSALRLPDDLLPALLAGATFFAVNNTLSGSVVALVMGEPVRRHLYSDVRFQIATSGVLLAFAPVVAASLERTLWLLPMLVLPIVAIHRSAELAAQREHEALHDGLTGLPNRAMFRLRLSRAIEEAARAQGACAVMLLDLDHFKEINDTLGHHVGDDLLRQVGARLQAGLRAHDTVARLGGDEFVVVVNGLPDERAWEVIAKRLLDELRDAFEVDGVRLEVAASLGVALFPAHGLDGDLLLQRADIALYAAKVERGRPSVYEEAADVHSPERLSLAAELRAGLERGEIFVQHQPKADLRSGAIIGFESLVRWRHPERGVVMPGSFLPVVENTDLITPLTLVVLDLALESAARWRAAGHDVSVAVNLSVRQLTDASLPRQVATALDKHHVPAEALVLEVTETLIMNDPARATEVLRALRHMGVALAVDDFGTGYSSLAYLRRLNVQELKIDRSFMKDLVTDAGNAVIVRSTIEMGRNLGLRTVAEGVEDAAAVEALTGWGCDVIQGYHLSPPLDDAHVLPWLEARPGWVQRPALVPAQQGAAAC